MFIQVIEGTTNDPGALHRRLDEWEHVMKVDKYLDLTDPWLTAAG